MKIAFVKFGGLSSGGTERWLQYMAFGLSEIGHEVDFYYCDSAPYLGSDYVHPNTNPSRFEYLNNSKVNLVKFEVGFKNVSVPTHDWIETNFWDLFDERKYDFVQTAKAGPPEYPFNQMSIPLVELVTLDAGADSSNNISWSILVSQSQRASWVQSGGNASRSAVIPVPVFPPSTEDDLRESLGISKSDIVAGFHQAPRDEIFSDIPLLAYQAVARSDRHFIVMSGSQKYQEQARRLHLRNIHFVDFSDDPGILSKFLNTLDFFSHGRIDGETFGTVFAEAMIHGKPCLSHLSVKGPNGHIETIGPAGYVVSGLSNYIDYLERFYSENDFRARLGVNALEHAKEFYSYDSALDHLIRIYQACFRDENILSQSEGYEYGYSKLGFLQAGPISDSASIANHMLVGGIPEEFDLDIASYFMKPESTFIDIGANIGLYCLRAVAMNPSSRVIAFEPQRLEFSMIEKTKFLNKWGENFQLLNLALSNSKGSSDLNLSGSGSTLNMDFLGETPTGKFESVETDKLDNFIGKIDFENAFLKIDVEGHELEVLQGAENVISRFRPTLFVEIAETLMFRNYRNLNFNKTLEFLVSARYRLVVSNGIDSLQIYRRGKEQDGVQMFLCIPEEHFYRTYSSLKIFMLKKRLSKLNVKLLNRLSKVSTRAKRGIKRRFNLQFW